VAFTDNSSIYGAVHEGSLDRLTQLAAQQWPSLFNYATAAVIAKPEWLCRSIDANPVVQSRHYPLITTVPPLPVLGTNGTYGLDYCIQLAVMQADFHPGNVISLPAPMPALAPDQMAVQIEVRGGIACPPDLVLAHLQPVVAPVDIGDISVASVIQTVGPLNCFRFDAYVVLSADLDLHQAPPVLDVHLVGFKMTGLLADALEALVECYVNLVAQLAILPRLRSAIPTEHLFHLSKLINTPDVTLHVDADVKLAPTSAQVPHNPAFEDDQLKAFLDLQVTEQP
jgi:hypothetical protein